MTRTKYLKGACAHCGGHIEFPADSIGMTTDCPHCGKPTELLLATPPQEPAISRRTIVWSVIAILILALGGIGLRAAFKLAQDRLPSRHEPAPVAASPTNPAPPAPDDSAANAGFRVSTITLEKEKPSGSSLASSLVYAAGTVTNPSAKRRFGVRVELDLLDDAGQKVGIAKDYQQVIEPNSEWRFKALVVGSKVASAKLASIKEDQ